MSTRLVFASEQPHKRTLADAMKGADVFVGLSGPNLLQPAELKLMAENTCLYCLLQTLDPEISVLNWLTGPVRM